MTNKLHKLISLVSFINNVMEGNYKISDFYYDSDCLFLKNGDFEDDITVIFENGTELNLYENVVCAFSHITNKNMLPMDVFDIDLRKEAYIM